MIDEAFFLIGSCGRGGSRQRDKRDEYGRNCAQTSGRIQEYKDHYTVLGLEAAATQKDIKRAYVQKALQLHPDRQSKEQTSDQSAEWAAVVLAYGTLSDEKARMGYDKYLPLRNALALFYQQLAVEVTEEKLELAVQVFGENPQALFARLQEKYKVAPYKKRSGCKPGVGASQLKGVQEEETKLCTALLMYVSSYLVHKTITPSKKMTLQQIIN
jgi:hypothetical protein